MGRGCTESPLLLLRETWEAFQRHNAQWLAAALAYFATFAVAPLIIVVVEIAGFVLHDHRHALDVVFGYMRRDLGPGSAAVAQIVSATFSAHPRGTLAQILSWTLFVIAAVGLFSSLQYALNTVWDVTNERLGIVQAILQRVLGFAMMLAVAALLLGSVFINAGLTTASAYLTHLFAWLATLLKATDFIVTAAFVWLLFALLFRYLPNTRIGWHDVWLGAGITALLFTIGQFLLGWYLGRAGVTSVYGAFGSLVAFLIWANYTAQIFLFGAEFTHVYALRHGTLAHLGADSAHGAGAAPSET